MLFNSFIKFLKMFKLNFHNLTIDMRNIFLYYNYFKVFILAKDFKIYYIHYNIFFKDTNNNNNTFKNIQ